MASATHESFENEWFTNPYLDMDASCRPVPAEDIPARLPSFTHGTCTASARIPVLWERDGRLFIFKKDPADCSHLFIERMAARLGHDIGAPVAPARIARHREHGVGCASLVLDPHAHPVTATSFEFNVMKAEQWRGQILKLALLDVLIGNSDNEARKHMLFSPKAGLYAFDFGGGTGHRPDRRYGLGFIDELGKVFRIDRDSVAGDLCALAQDVAIDGVSEEAALFKRDYPKRSLSEAIDRFVSGTETRLQALQDGDVFLGEGPHHSLYVRLGKSTFSPSTSRT